jgi:vitamin B12 transport system substrate-binding protein
MTALTLALLFFCHVNNSHASQQQNDLRIITLSPHLTEIVFALNKGEYLVGVSDFSDFPKQAANLPSVANYEGANIADIIRLKPSHVLVWRGGNKDADIEKLKSLDIHVVESNINSVKSMLSDILKIGKVINAQSQAQELVDSLQAIILKIALEHRGASKTAVYYFGTHPLLGLGNDKWLNSLLQLCSIENVYSKSVSAYPQLQIVDIIRQQPELLISANKNDITQVKDLMSQHNKVLKAHIVSADPDALHRFTPRAIVEMARLCDEVHL